MLIILSPAKSLDFETKFFHPKPTIPFFEKEKNKLVQDLKKFSEKNFQDLMEISENLAKLNFQRYQNFNEQPLRPAILAFDGDVYDGFDKKNFQPKDYDFAQNHLLILSGLYGLLRPLDLIQAHRLEMGTDFKKFNFLVKNLCEFWQDKITEMLNKNPQETIINLASQEYFKAVNSKKINKKIIEINFKEKKQGQYKVVGINSKKARGLMANFIIKNKITKPTELQKFKLDNYHFNQELSSKENWVFTR
ncbi:MAG: peroxide stress protein YaaA [Alphaproteobacteria bacterium]